MIDPTNLEHIHQLEQDEIAFPEIYYVQNAPLNRTATTLHAAYRTISDRVDPVYLTGLEWNVYGDLQWQNNMLQ